MTNLFFYSWSTVLVIVITIIGLVVAFLALVIGGLPFTFAVWYFCRYKFAR